MKRKVCEHAWAYTAHEVADFLHTDIQQGITERVAAERLASYGENTFGEGSERSATMLFVRQFTNPLILVLLAAGAVTLGVQEWINAAVILIAMFTSVFLGFYQEYKAERATDALRSYIENRVRTIRGGKEMEINARTVVPGDLVRLLPGVRVPADGRIVQLHDLRLDESILTGESLSVLKKTTIIAKTVEIPDRLNMVFGGTLVTEGEGFAIVTATGQTTEIGKIAQSLAHHTSTETPLTKSVRKFSVSILGVVCVLIAGIVVLGLERGMSDLDIFLIGVAVAVGAVPEALPVGLTAILAVGVQRIAKKKGIVRSLVAAETLGSATVIITDKTGTLTEGKLELVDVITTEALLRGKRTHVSGEEFTPTERDILMLAATNTEVIIENREADAAAWRYVGRHLEVGIIRAASKQGIDVAALIGDAFTSVVPFGSAHKYSVYEGDVVLESGLLGDGKGVRRVQIAVGAPDVLLGRSMVSAENHAKMLASIDDMGVEGKRLLGVAVRSVPRHGVLGEVLRAKDFIFVGVLAFSDPLRGDVAQAMRDIAHTGVRVIMATGDLSGTAKATALQLGWSISAENILTGEQLRQMDDDALIRMLPDIKIYARMTPDDKFRVVQALQVRGGIVAMTGDGVNDAPSLRMADIGIALGSGTDVAKGVADLVLLDDNFATIKAAIFEGKLILANIRKMFVFLTSSLFIEIIVIGGSLLLGLPLPLTALQIIWVNFVTDSIPAIAYAFDTEYSHKKIKDAGIFTREVLTLSFGIGTLSSLSVLGLYWILHSILMDATLVSTIVFASFASYSLFIAYPLRSLHTSIFSFKVFGNVMMNTGVAMGTVGIGLVIYVPFLQNIFNTTTLGMVWLLFVALWVVLNIILVEITKWFFYRK